MGRPRLYNPEVAQKVIDLMAEGNSLRSICSQPGMPPISTVRHWAIDDVDGFAAQYARAREMQGHAAFEKALQVAEEAKDPALARLHYDALKWHATKLAPRDYGDKVTQEHTGPGGKDLFPTLNVTISNE
jgi:hypothetical protein